MLLIYFILLLVVSPDFGYSTSDDYEVTGSGFLLYSCLVLGGSCIPKETAQSFSGGNTTRCFGQRECRDGFSCCLETEYIAKNSISGKKRSRIKRQAVTFKPGRAIQCPSADSDPRCGVPDEWNPDGGRCRKTCKQGKQSKQGMLNAERPGPDVKNVCPQGNGCTCCFRVKTCRKLKACSKSFGECRGVCLEGETPLGKGCRNNCICCVPNALVSALPACQKKGERRCTTKVRPTCEADRSETLADDKYSCKPYLNGDKRSCCVRDLGPIVERTCEAQGQKCKKKKVCDGSIGQRDMTDKYPCPNAKGGKKKICCLKDCYHWRSGTWYAHGERHLYECEWAVCNNGKYTTYGQERNAKCCEDKDTSMYHEENGVVCRETLNHTDYSQKCVGGSWVDETELHKSCTEPATTVATSEENNDENAESRLIYDSLKEEIHKVEEHTNESDQGDPSEGENKIKVNKGKWKKGQWKKGEGESDKGKMEIGKEGIAEKGIVKKKTWINGIGKKSIGKNDIGKKIMTWENKVKGQNMVKGKTKEKVVSGPGVIKKGMTGKWVKG